MNAADVLLNTIQGVPALKPYYADDFIMCCVLMGAFIMAMVLSDRKHYFIRLFKGFFSLVKIR